VDWIFPNLLVSLRTRKFVVCRRDLYGLIYNLESDRNVVDWIGLCIVDNHSRHDAFSHESLSSRQVFLVVRFGHVSISRTHNLVVYLY
jgi:hypothetical protein